MVARADPGQHENVRRPVGAGAEYDLALGPGAEDPAVALVFHADRAAMLEHDAADVSSGGDRQVRALARGRKEGVGGGLTAAAACRRLDEGSALLDLTVAVVDSRHAH